jgi:hypothetical protein
MHDNYCDSPWARDNDVIVQVSGIGPSGTVYVEPGPVRE